MFSVTNTTTGTLSKNEAKNSWGYGVYPIVAFKRGFWRALASVVGHRER